MELLLWMVCFIVLAQILGSQCCLREEREALLDIKAFLHTYGDTSMDSGLSSWVRDSNSDCCSWNRVKCHPSSGRVTMLSLQGLNIGFNPFKSIDFSLFQNFKELRSLNFSQGHFSTLIHTQVMANLSNLEVLILKDNYLEGPLPIQDLCGLKKIRVLDFSHNAFQGPLPKCLTNLTSLQALDLSSNYLTGEIPTSAIASLTSLEYLSLMYNSFEGLFPLSSFANNSQLKVLALQMDTDKFQVDTEDQAVPWVPLFQLQVLHMPKCKINMPRGTFPSFLLYQNDLQYLDLSNNNLVGMFPNWLLVNNTNLTSQILHDNLLTGPFELPTNIDQPLHPLIDLQLSNNKLEGKLPKDIGQIFPNLEVLNISGNGLNGGIATSLGNMSKLFFLDLSRNNFSGEVPESLWTGCTSLRYLILSHNNLWGPLFPSPLNLSSLHWLLMNNNNNLNGTLEHGKWELPELRGLDISNNNFWGIVPSFISNFSSLEVINLSGNNFEGSLPREFCKLDLYHLLLSQNKLSGSIPACYLNLENLLSLHLQSNSLVGSIPKLRKTASFLTSLDLRDNNLSGGIPDWIERMEWLRALLLGGNQFQGQLPNQLCQLVRINFLDLSRNNFSGSIPTCFYNVSFGDWKYRFNEYDMTLILSDSWYQYNHLHLLLFFEENIYFMTAVAGGVEVEFRTKESLLSYRGDVLRFMSGIDLSGNQLTGQIPQEMGSLASLHALNLSHNHLNGSIPESFHKLENIESLDLSYNNLSGVFPIQLQDLHFLGIFNVSYNNLSGTVPSGAQFGDESSFIGNRYLSWIDSNRGTTKPVPPTPTLSNNEKEDDSVIDFTSFIWSFAAAYVTVLFILVTILWINPRWRREWLYFIETCLFRCFYPYLKDAFY